MKTSYYSSEELKSIGIKFSDKFGGGLETVKISRKASIYGAQNITISDYVRIDDFCILSGNINIGHNVHIAAYASLFAGETGIDVQDYVGISSRCALYAESDDYSGIALTNPTIPDKYKHIISGKIVLEKHSLIGTGCTVLPGVTIGEGTSVGSMSLISKSLDAWGVYVGIPCRRIKDRYKKILELQKEYEESLK